MDYYIVIIDEQVIKFDRDTITEINSHVDIKVLETVGPS